MPDGLSSLQNVPGVRNNLERMALSQEREGLVFQVRELVQHALVGEKTPDLNPERAIKHLPTSEAVSMFYGSPEGTQRLGITTARVVAKAVECQVRKGCNYFTSRPLPDVSHLNVRASSVVDLMNLRQQLMG